MRAGAPQQKKKAVSRGLGVIIVIIAAIIIVTVAYFATRKGGFSGQKTLADIQMERAQRQGFDNPKEMMGSRMGGAARRGQPPAGE